MKFQTLLYRPSPKKTSKCTGLRPQALTCFWKLFPAIFHLRVLDVIVVVEKYHVEVAVEVVD